jgi:hypothetical protein
MRAHHAQGAMSVTPVPERSSFWSRRQKGCRHFPLEHGDHIRQRTPLQLHQKFAQEKESARTAYLQKSAATRASVSAGNAMTVRAPAVVVYLGLGDNERGLDGLKKAYEPMLAG